MGHMWQLALEASTFSTQQRQATHCAHLQQRAPYPTQLTATPASSMSTVVPIHLLADNAATCCSPGVRVPEPEGGHTGRAAAGRLRPAGRLAAAGQPHPHRGQQILYNSGEHPLLSEITYVVSFSPRCC
jgi:hypothetical protein